MAARLTLNFFDDFQIKIMGAAASGVKTNKARAILAYLALEADRAHRRSILAEFFWPNKPEGTARNNLKQALSTLRLSLGDRESASPFLLIDRESIHFNSGSDYWIDADEFARLIEDSKAHSHNSIKTCLSCVDRLRQAVELYQGDFLAQFSLPDSAAFEEWVVTNREAYQRQMLDVLRNLTAHEKHNRDYLGACHYAKRMVELEPWNEENHRDLIDLLAQSGQRSVALKQYQTCQRILADELGVEPSEETTELFTQIRDGQYKHAQSSSQNRKKTASNPFRKKLTTLLLLIAMTVLFVVLGNGLLTGSQNPNANQTVAESFTPTPSQSFSASSDVGQNISQSEYQVLETFYNETGGADWNNSNGWLSDTAPCTWFGVSCGEGSVNELNLPDNNLNGNIPWEISLLANLKTLNLEFNHLSGGIPPELGRLYNLEYLSLTGNSRLSGPIPPELGNLANLDTLVLSSHEGGTQLSGPIPPELGNLARLTYLEIGNALLSGFIPPELGNLTNLQWFDLGNNRLSGLIPSELGNLVNLQTLSIGEGRNEFSGGLPLGLMSLKKLNYFQFKETGLCEPPDAAFQEWLNSIEDLWRTGVLCETDD